MPAQSSKRNSNAKVSSRSKKEVDYVVNPVMVGAMNLPSSRFENKYEDDGLNVTLDMNTERL